jgi:hypothetical protein
LDAGVYICLVFFSISSLRTSIAILNWIGARLRIKSFQQPTPPFWTGLGGKKIVISDSHSFVWRFMELFGRKGSALAHGINSFVIEGVHTNAASDERAVALDRRSILAIGRPDGRHPIWQPAESAALMLGKHAKSVLTLPFMFLQRLRVLPISAYVITFGSNNPPEKSELMARHKHLGIGTNHSLQGKEEVPHWAQEFYGDRIDACV